MNELREQIILKIYLTVTDVRNFMRCNWKSAHKYYDACYQKCIDDEKANVKGKIYYKYLLDLVGLKEAEIHRMARIEREIKKSLPTMQSESDKYH